MPKFGDLASRSKQTWSDDANALYAAASEVFRRDAVVAPELGGAALTAEPDDTGWRWRVWPDAETAADGNGGSIGVARIVDDGFTAHDLDGETLGPFSTLREAVQALVDLAAGAHAEG